MTARILLTCEEHPTLLMCDDDDAFEVETIGAARALWAAKHRGSSDSKIARVRIGCEIGGCMNLISFSADSVTQGRLYAGSHHYGWYLARRAIGRLVDGCQWHLGTCCVHHARRLWRGHPNPTLDPAAVLPGEPGYPGQEPERPDLFDYHLQRMKGTRDDQSVRRAGEGRPDEHDQQGRRGRR